MTLTEAAGHGTGGVQAVLFDTFGTVVDWRCGVSAAVERVCHAHGIRLDPEAFADAWRAKYEPSMDSVRNGTRPFTKLATLHRENLTATLTEFAVQLDDQEVDELNHAWEQVRAWPDSVEGLALLKQRYIVGPLSNGNVGLLTRMAKEAGLPWDVIIGSDLTGRYKPQPEAYLGAAALLELEPAQVMMAAAHNYDLAAARRAGLSTAFILRAREFGPAQTTNLRPESDWDIVADDLIDLARQLESGR